MAASLFLFTTRQVKTKQKTPENLNLVRPMKLDEIKIDDGDRLCKENGLTTAIDSTSPPAADSQEPDESDKTLATPNEVIEQDQQAGCPSGTCYSTSPVGWVPTDYCEMNGDSPIIPIGNDEYLARLMDLIAKSEAGHLSKYERRSIYIFSWYL